MPINDWNDPALQFVHTVSPSDGEYVPNRQFKHDAVDFAAIVVEYVPLTQLEHADESFWPSPVEKVPAMQPVH
jgi:hypothetical protein